MNRLPIADFGLERYFARWEFAVEHQLSASDVEPYSLAELLALADADARELWDRLTLGYTESSGHPMLRAAIAALYDGIAPEHILVCAGAEEGIFLGAHAILSAGDEAVVVTPAYQSLHTIPESIGAVVRTVELRPECGWSLDPDELERAVTSRTRLIVINFPHNPTGAHIGADVQRALIDIAEQAGAMLFSDEVYRGLEYDASHQLPPAADLSPSAVSLGVMSKAFALAGLRIGWLASHNRAFLDRVARLKDYTTICSSAPSEALSIIALRSRARVLERSRAIVRANLESARSFFESASDVEWIPPRAGSVAFPRFVRHRPEEVAVGLAEAGRTLLVPGSLFGPFPEHFRLGLGRRDFPVALGKLRDFLA